MSGSDSAEQKGTRFPVERVIPEVQRALTANRPVVLSAPPGSGKTTCLPPALLNAPWLKGRKIILLEPRRLAARRAVAFMAARRGEQAGETIGYQIRLERKISSQTRLEILTEGLLTQRLLSDPELHDVGLIIFDEFHERNLNADLGFALTCDVRSALREDLRLIVMSATLSENELLRHLGSEAVFIESPAKMYSIETRYLPPVGKTPPLPLQVAHAIRKGLAEETGSILAFLPGEREIRQTMDHLSAHPLSAKATVHPLYAALDTRAQDRAVAPPEPGERKIVLATSIAESAITIEGIRMVIDCGWMRVSRFSSRNGLSRLETLRISKDRADQRRGRAGRTEPGICYRLWDESLQHSLPDRALPEILETDLSSLLLICAEWGTTDRDGLPWLTPPRESAWQQAKETLTRLGALTPDGRITEHGREMVRLPVHPALAHLMLLLRRKDPCGGALLAATLTELQSESSLRDETDFRRILDVVIRSDSPFTRRVRQLASRWTSAPFPPRLSSDELTSYLCEAFPRHIARRRGSKGNHYLTAAGFGAFLPDGSPLASSEWLILTQVTEDGPQARIRNAAPLPLDFVEELIARYSQEEDCVSWDRLSDGLMAHRRQMLGSIVLKESPLQNPPQETVEAALLEGIRRKGIAQLNWSRAASTLRARIQAARTVFPEEGWPAVDNTALEENLSEWLAPALGNCRRWSQIEQIDLTAALSTYLEQYDAPGLPPCGTRRSRLDQLLPTHFTVPSGSKIPIHYEGDIPYLAVRIQEVFGLTKTPALCNGRLPVTLHLLSPAQRPVQITRDLESFWKNGYAETRKDLRGRYPKHYWPEDPTQAVATNRVRPPGN